MLCSDDAPDTFNGPSGTKRQHPYNTSRPEIRAERAKMQQITKAEYDRIGNDFKGVWHDYWGDHPEWKGRRVAFLPGHGTTLFIEGVSFEIVDKRD